MSTLYPVQTAENNGLVIGSNQFAAVLPVHKYVNPNGAPVTTNLGAFGAGSDDNPGTLAQPYLTFKKGWESFPDLKAPNNRLFVASGNDSSLENRDYHWPSADGLGTPLVVIGSKEDVLGTLIADPTSTDTAWVVAAPPVVADDFLHGMYLLNTANGVDGARAKVDTNVTAGSMTISLPSPGIPPGSHAAGSIQSIAGVDLIDGETFTLNDGVNPAVVFEFDSGGGVAPGNVAVPFTGGDSAATVASAIETAINGAALLDITSSIDPLVDPALVALYNDAFGPAGNQTITDTVVNAGFVVTGMAGGGNEFIIERSTTNLLVQPFDVPAFVPGSGVIQGGMKDIRFASASDPPFAIPLVAIIGFPALEGMDFDGGAAGRGVLSGHPVARMQGSLPQPWFADGANNPFADGFTFGPNRFTAQAYMHTTNPFGMQLNIYDRASCVGMMIMDKVFVLATEMNNIDFDVCAMRDCEFEIQNNALFRLNNTKMAGDLGSPAPVRVLGGGEVRIGADFGPVEINGATGHALLVNGQASVTTHDFAGTGNGDHGISLQGGAKLIEKTAGTTVTGTNGDLLVGAVTRAYTQTPFSENETQSLETGALASIGAVNNVTGLTGMSTDNVGDTLAITDSATPANNDTHLIIQVVSATEVKVASVLVLDASGTVGWTLKSSRATGNRAA